MEKNKQEERRTVSPQRDRDIRSEFARDRARITHSSAFRRLQGKTQVLGLGEGDFYRTRLTHSMEVAQIGRGIVRYLKRNAPDIQELLDEDLIESICLSHDLGHPPFGHVGERALNYCMRDHGGFEGNGQTLRILTCLEPHTEKYGLNLTRRTLLGVIKYPISYNKATKKEIDTLENIRFFNSDKAKPPKCYLNTEKDVVDWVYDGFESPDEQQVEAEARKSLDASIMDVSDNIAYQVHDLEDGIALKLINREHWEANKLDEVLQTLDNFREYLGKKNAKASDLLFSNGGAQRKEAIGSLIHALMLSVEIKKMENFTDDLLKYNANMSNEASNVLNSLSSLVFSYMIDRRPVKTLEYRGCQIILSLFDALSSSPKLMPVSYQEQKPTERAVCDYIAGMTDEYATKTYERLFVPRRGSIFEPL